ncbi:hypothetical protein [Actinomadura sp. 9N215]
MREPEDLDEPEDAGCSDDTLRESLTDGPDEEPEFETIDVGP